MAKRYQASAEWHKKHSNVSPSFGLFWNFCLNGYFPGQGRVHCKPHADSKNPVGVCALMAYVLPGCKYLISLMLDIITQLIAFCTDNFDHGQKSWLVIWEAGVVIELPPWVLCIYPSSLFYHFNIDINGEGPLRLLFMKYSFSHSRHQICQDQWGVAYSRELPTHWWY